MHSALSMRLSRFNLYVDDAFDDGDVLIHNTLSGAYVVLDRDTLEWLRRVDAEDSDIETDLADPDVGIVVSSYEAEEQEFRDWFERQRSHTEMMDVLISINRACNFDCPYCLQANVMDGTVMKPAVAEQTAEWIAERAAKVGVQSIQLGFAGGEPLLHPRVIEQIVLGVRRRSDIPVSFQLITNGVFLTPEMTERLAAIGLAKAKVTLDGDETTHHLTRISKRGDNTFSRIVDNVVAASRHIQISINGNYQDNTVHGFAPLVRKLAEAGLPRGTSISFSPALDGLDAPDGAGSGACTWSQSNMGHQVRLFDEILGAGFRAAPLNAVGPCEYHELHSFAIDPDGTIYKCPGFLAKPEWGIGHVSSGITDRYDDFVAATPQKSCEGCAHRPDCGGGCVANAFLENGRLEGVGCEKQYFRRVNDDAVARNFILETAEDGDDPPSQFPAPKLSPERDRSIRSPALRVLA